MELINALAEYFKLSNADIIVDTAQGNVVWFHTKAGARYTCKTVRGGKFLKKNSIRID